MLKKSKNFLFYSVLLLSLVSLINMIALYWIPIHIPFSLYSITGLMVTAYFLKAYYLIPICFLFCILMFLSAFSFVKEKILLPIVLTIYLLCDLFLLACRFFTAWIKDGYFIPVQAIQTVVSITVITFIFIYFASRRKTANDS